MPDIIKKFFMLKSAPGILLCLMALLAMVMENTLLNGLYDSIKGTPVVLQIGAFAIDKPLLLWINDGLMALFFLLVGLEIKREILEGHLSKRDQITLPAIAALGGLITPALIYSYINIDYPVLITGWAIPAATDIAFALGVLMLMGSRVPKTLKICLVAIATIDDLAAIVIIAVFYTDNTSLFSLCLAAIGLAVAYILNRRNVTRLGPYILLGLFIWACVLKSGIHATLAGVALGLIVPLRTQNADGKSPLKVMEHELHGWVSFGVLPIFAFANAGVSLASVNLKTFLEPITLGIMLGLFFGKQIGVMVFTGLGVLLKICRLPEGVNWLQFYGMALLTGIGFTMSLFIGTLAFTNIEYVSAVRLGVLSGSLLSAFAGIIVLLISTRPRRNS